MRFRLFSANCLNLMSNCEYPNEAVVTDADSIKKAVSHDYVCATYRNNYRKSENFIESDCLPVDCDNIHSDDPEEWIQPSDVAEAFPGVAFAVHYSRNHMKPKDGKAARPKFHVLFPIKKITDGDAYKVMKMRVSAFFPFFDPNALDIARVFVGTPSPEVEIIDGDMTVDTFLEEEEDFDAGMESGTYGDLVIPQGSRNSTMARYAVRILKRFGDTEEAHAKYLDIATKCVPPLEGKELENIWKSGQRFYNTKIKTQEGYIPPEQYDVEPSLVPDDYSDVGQAMVLAREYSDKLRYSPATDFIVFNGSYWEESKPKAQGIAQELTARQLLEAKQSVKKGALAMAENGTVGLITPGGGNKAYGKMNPSQKRIFEKYEDSECYLKYVIRHRDSKYITSALKEAQPMLEIDHRALDSNEFLLNTPSATYDLREGASEPYPHNPEDFITKQTSVDPDDDGMDAWLEAVNLFFQGDAELVAYVQKIAGLVAIGKVHLEALIIAYGEGSNGKSTFWNTIARVLGTYSGNISADALTAGCKRNIKPEMAEAKGKRLLIAAELEEGTRLSTSTVKQLCATDDIYAEKKYKAPHAFTPTHTLVLYTNHLPRVSALDTGTWRRLIVIPFNARIEGKSDIKNYADYLFEHSGGAVLSWIMEGAKQVIKEKYNPEKPQVVKDAIQGYRENNDWLSQFLEDCCEVGETYTAKSSEVYTTYRGYCQQYGEYVRSTTDFYTALDQAGFERHRTKAGVTVMGLRLKTDYLEDPSEDFLE